MVPITWTKRACARDRGMGDACLGRGEIENDLGAAEGLQNVVVNGHVERGAAQRLAEIASDPVVALAFQCSDEPQPGMGPAPLRSAMRPIRPAAPVHHASRSVVHVPLRSSVPAVYPLHAVLAKRRLRQRAKTHTCTSMAKSRFNEGAGPSQRQLRVGELIRRRLSEVLTRGEVHDPDLNALSITVGEVRASPDLRVATAYVMPLGGEDRDAAIEVLAA